MPKRSTDGYSEEADELAVRYELITFSDLHADTLHLFPSPPARIIDIGAGTGRDAAALSRLGHTVVAVEPTSELRRHGQALHPDPAITWLDDGLPDLAMVLAHKKRFDLILLTAVWMHLDQTEQVRALPHLASLLAPNGRIIMSLRHGPVPKGRRMFDVTGDAVVALAAQSGLVRLFETRRGDHRSRHDVTWTILALSAPDKSTDDP